MFEKSRCYANVGKFPKIPSQNFRKIWILGKIIKTSHFQFRIWKISIPVIILKNPTRLYTNLANGIPKFKREIFRNMSILVKIFENPDYCQFI